MHNDQLMGIRGGGGDVDVEDSSTANSKDSQDSGKDIQADTHTVLFMCCT